MPASGGGGGGGGFVGAVENAAGGAFGGGIVGAGINLLEHAFGLGGAPKEDPITQQARQLQLQAQQRQMQFAGSVPGSDPSELAALSQDRGALGAAQRQQSQQLMGAYNPQMGSNGLADMLRNLSNSQVGQQMSLQESHLMNALSARRQALTEAANSGGRVQGPQYQPQSDLPQLLGQVAQSISYQMGRDKSGGAGTAGTGAGTRPSYPGAQTGGTTLGMGGQPGFTPQMPGNFPQAQGGNLTPPGGMGGSPAQTQPFFGGALPQPLYNQPGGPMDTTLQMPQQMQGTGAQPVNAQGGGYNIDGSATLQNQIQRSFSPWLRLG